MKCLYLMGGSGCGKTTLAKNLQIFDGKQYKRIVQTTTRAKRAEEVEGYDYFFVNDREFDCKRKKMFEAVEKQFAPARYCAYKEQLDPNKWNVVVVSIEGFLSALKLMEFNDDDELILVNILNDCELDIDREGRDPKAEENINLAVLNQFINSSRNGLSINDQFVQYHELPLSSLKAIRNNKEKVLEYFMELFNNEK